jgi:hypothetical protein
MTALNEILNSQDKDTETWGVKKSFHSVIAVPFYQEFSNVIG